MNEDFRGRTQKAQEERQDRKFLLKEKLAEVPFERRDSAFVLSLLQSEDLNDGDVMEAIESNSFPQTALTFEVAKALPLHQQLGKEIRKFFPDDYQKIIEWYIKTCDSRMLHGFIHFALAELADCRALNRRAITEALLHSNLPASAILENLEYLDVAPAEISKLIDASLDGGYIESVIRVLEKIPDMDERVFIEKLLTHHEEARGNAIKIISQFHKFHVEKEWFENMLRKYDTADFTELLERKGSKS